jgi:hypothetical protein
MTLLNNYLAAVGKHLPDRQRDDILEELSANLTAEIEDQEASLGRPVTDDEVAAVLKRHGHPMIAAARYAPQRYLIGPSLFPIYWYVLARALPIAALIYSIASAATVAAGAQRFGEALLRLPGVLFGVAAWVTLVFAVGEFGARKYHWKFAHSPEWNPRDLPNAEAPRPESRIKPICGFLVSLLFTAWIAAVPYFPVLLLGPGAAYVESLPIRPAPIWAMLYWPAVIFFLARSVLDFATAMRPSWRIRRDWAEVVLHGISAVAFAIILKAGEYFSLVPDRADAANYRDAVAGLNQAVMIVAAIALVIAIAETALAARRVILDARTRRLAPPSVCL